MDRPDPFANRRRLVTRLRVGFVVLVAVSAGLIAVYAGGSLSEIAVLVASGGALGALLVWIAFPTPDEATPDRLRDRR